MNTLQTEPKVAHRHIKCYKVIIQNDDGITWSSPIFRGMKFKDNNKFSEVILAQRYSGDTLDHLVPKESNWDYARLRGWNRVDYGFHAYTKYRKNLDSWKIALTDGKNDKDINNLRCAIAIIPKGAEYFVGIVDNEIVATRIVVFKNWWDYIKWRLLR